MKRIGLIGTGHFAKKHLLAWREIPNVEVIGVHGSNEERLRKFAQQNELSPVVSLDELVQHADILDIVSTNDTHLDYAGKCLHPGKAIIIEKPVDIDLEKAKAFQLEASEKKIPVTVISQLRYRPSFEETYRILNEGQLENISTCRATVVWPRDAAYFESRPWLKDRKKAGGGVLIHQAIHHIDLLQWFFGPVDSVFGKTDQNATERSFWGTIGFKSGVVCQLFFTTEQMAYEGSKIEIYGRAGNLLVTDNGVYPGLALGSLKAQAGLLPGLVKDRFQKAITETPNPLKRQLKEFVSATTSVWPEQLPTLTSGIDALRTVKALYQIS